MEESEEEEEEEEEEGVSSDKPALSFSLNGPAPYPVSNPRTVFKRLLCSSK